MLTILFRTILLSTILIPMYSAKALERNSKMICVGSKCHEEVELKNYDEVQVYISDLQVGECVVSLSDEQNPKYFLVNEINNRVGYARAITPDGKQDEHFRKFVVFLNINNDYLKREKVHKFPCDRIAAFSPVSEISKCLLKSKKPTYFCDVK